MSAENNKPDHLPSTHPSTGEDLKWELEYDWQSREEDPDVEPEFLYRRWVAQTKAGPEVLDEGKPNPAYVPES